MRLRDGFWSIEVPLTPGEHRYRYEIESLHSIPDPEALEVHEDVDGLWSVRRVEPIRGS
jgi:1,4-alpha-glucan branching enzyme